MPCHCRSLHDALRRFHYTRHPRPRREFLSLLTFPLLKSKQDCISSTSLSSFSLTPPLLARRGLIPHWVGRRISFVDLRRPDLRFPFPSNLEEALTGAKVVEIGRASKYLLIRLDNGNTWLSHLGMTGVWTIDSPGDGICISKTIIFSNF